MQAKRLICTVAVALIASNGVHAQPATDVPVTRFPSPYMHAKDTPLVTLENGAKVGRDTEAVWQLPPDAAQRASYDQDIVVQVADGIWTLGSPSLVNVHAVQGPEGLIIYDTGEHVADGARFYRLLRLATAAPIRAIIYSHEHYVHGTTAFVEEEARRGNTDIMIIGHPNTNAEVARTGGTFTVHPEVAPVLLARALEQFNAYLPATGPDAGVTHTSAPGADGFVPVTTPVQDGQPMQVAGLDLVFYTEGIGTDTSNQVLVWIPSRKAVLNNVIWGWFPTISSARGGDYRNPALWMATIERLRALNPDILLSTHSTSLAGADTIQQRLDDYRDALAFVLDQTLKGILLGLGPEELRYFVTLPPRLAQSPILIQNYSDLALMPPRIYHALFGQFDRNAASLNRLHPLEEAQRLVHAMGGPAAVYAKAHTAHQDGDYLWACQLADYLVKASDNATHRQLKANCLREMGYRALAQHSRSWYLSQALALEEKVHIIKAVPARPGDVVRHLADYVANYGVRINAARSATTDQVLGLRFGNDQAFALHVRHGLADFAPTLEAARRQADVVVELTPAVWAEVYNNRTDPAALIDSGEIQVVHGAVAAAKALFALFDPVYDWQHDKALHDIAAQLSHAIGTQP